MKKKIIKTILILFALLIISIVVLFITNTLLSDGVSHQKEYCNKFIPELAYYYEKHHEYPESLMAFGGKAHLNFRYSAKNCQYKHVDKGYIFSVSSGLTFENYESWKDEWRDD